MQEVKNGFEEHWDSYSMDFEEEENMKTRKLFQTSGQEQTIDLKIYLDK